MLSSIFRNTISENGLCKKHHRILVAVSGGKDSMALLHLFHSEGYQVEAAHVNFKLRGAESDEDEALVCSFCHKAGIPFHGQSFDTKTFAAEHGWSTQMAARELRYNWFEKLAAEHQLDRIATAHHLHDNLETLLLNFTKGTGPRGLTGIPLKTGLVIRPLLYAEPGHILSYLEENGISWRDDRTNADDHYQRNRIRNRVIPLLKTINPGLESTFAVNLERFLDLQVIFEANLRKFETLLSKKNAEIRIPLESLTNTPGITLVLEEFLKKYGFNRQDTQLVLKVAETGKRILSASHVIIRERNYWLLTEKKTETLSESLITGAGIYPAGDRYLSVSMADLTTAPPDYSDPDTALLDADRVTWPLTLRLWRDGDRFVPFGMKGSKRVSDFLKDLKINASEKKKQWLVADSREILWLAGHRIAHPFRITDTTRRILRLEWTGKPV